jgi:L-threonylcarbamoyladenylate synthase
VGIESTVVSLAGSQPVLLRPGMVSAAAIAAVAGPLGETPAEDDTQSQPSPGMHRIHYAPRTPLRIGVPNPARRCAYLWRQDALPAAFSRRLAEAPEPYAASLYAALHDADEQAVEEIVVEPVPGGPAWDAIRDRLARAAATIQDDAP